MEFVPNGNRLALDQTHVEQAVLRESPDALQQCGVRVSGVVYPVKQVLSLATGLPRGDFKSQTARRLLARLGFEVIGGAPPLEPRDAAPDVSHPRGQTLAPEPDPRGWPWEGRVQSLFAGFLFALRWRITAMADTATKARWRCVGAQGRSKARSRSQGLAREGLRGPSSARRGEARTGQHPSGALVLAGRHLSHPGYESVVVLPDYPRYRDLSSRTRTGLQAANVHMVFVRADGTVTSDTWMP